MSGKSLKDRLAGAVPEIKLPTLMREVEIPVYLVHHSRDPEDYFFLIDFEEFVERSTEGAFVRPKLRVWAGRDDFSRTQFARSFREVFAVEFDLMRVEQTAKPRKGGLGWLSWWDAFSLDPAYLGKVVANATLALALLGGKMLLSNVNMPKWLKGKSAGRRLQDEIEGTREAVETALGNIEVSLHPELYDHAWRGGRMGKNARLERDAWPLPSHVRTHLDDGNSGSWW